MEIKEIIEKFEKEIEDINALGTITIVKGNESTNLCVGNGNGQQIGKLLHNMQTMEKEIKDALIREVKKIIGNDKLAETMVKELIQSCEEEYIEKRVEIKEDK